MSASAVSARAPMGPTRRMVSLVAVAAFMIVAACGDTGGTSTSTTDDSLMPPLTLSAAGNQIDLSAFAFCWQDLCGDGFADPPDFVVPVGEPIEMRFPAAGWTLRGEEPTDGVWQLEPLPAGTNALEVTITGRGPEGDGAWGVRLVSATAAPGAAGATDAEVVTAFAAAVAAGDRAAAELVATPNVIDSLEPWDPFPGAALIDERPGVFTMQLTPDYALGCDVGRGQVQACAPIVDEGQVDDEFPDQQYGVEDAFFVTYTRVGFPPGEYGTIVSDAVVRGDRAVYLLNAQAGQSMLVDIVSLENNAVFDVYSPSGELLAAEATSRAIFLSETGDYHIVVGGTRGNASYDLSVYAYRAEVVRFPAGATGTTVSDAVVRGEQVSYILGAAAGQTMSVSLTSVEDNAVLSVRSPSGAVLASEVADAEVVLPEGGDYQVLVGSTRANATFDLTVSITG